MVNALKVSLFSLLILSHSLSYAQLSIDTNVDADGMANILGGSGVMIESASLNCPDGAYGLYYGQNSNLGSNFGVLLTTGDAQEAVGPNYTSNATGSTSGNPGDPILDALPTTQGTNDACALTLMVSSTCADTILFNFIFGSDEYLEGVNGFIDAMGVFVSGPGIAGTQNVALVPGTSDPVGLSTINDVTNSAYYIDNGNGGPPQDNDITVIQYDGFTTVLTAAFPVVPFSTYEIRIVVADDVDTAIDSGIFIEAGSLISLDSNSGLIADAGSDQDVCEGEEIDLDASSSINVDTYTWSGSPQINDVNAEATTVSLTESTMIYLHTVDASGCEDEDSLFINILPLPSADAGENITSCEIYDGPIGPADVDAAYTYEWTTVDGTVFSTDPNPNVLLESPDGTLVSETYFLNVSVGANCISTDEVSVTLEGTSSINAGMNDTIVNGSATVLSATGAGANGMYMWEPADLVSQVNAQTVSVAPVVTTDFYVTAVSETGCEGIDTVTVVVLTRPDILVPTAFSPNGDSNNDLLGLNFVEVEELIDFRVYNRYGQLLFNAGGDMSARWDGTYKGNPQPIGTYTYVLKYRAVDEEDPTVQMGNVTLIR